MKKPTNLIVGQQLIRTIGEPWDFSSDAGPNRFLATITELPAPGTASEWIRLDFSPFKYDGKWITKVLSTRRNSYQPFFKEILFGDRCTAHFYFRQDGVSECSVESLNTDLKSGAAHFLIGSLRSHLSS